MKRNKSLIMFGCICFTVMLAVGSHHTKLNVSSTFLFFLFCQYRNTNSKAVVFLEWALFCKVHYVALPCFYSSPVGTNQTLALESGFCVFSNNCGEDLVAGCH